MSLNLQWEQRITDGGADFVHFVDLSILPSEMFEGYPCAVLFGKALSREYVSAIQAGLEPKHKEVNNTERKMDTLAVKVAAGWRRMGTKVLPGSNRGSCRTRRLRSGPDWGLSARTICWSPPGMAVR